MDANPAVTAYAPAAMKKDLAAKKIINRSYRK